MFKISNANGNSSVSFYCAQEEFSGVKKIAAKVCKDILLVTDALPSVKEKLEDCSEYAVVFGTENKSSEFKALAEKAGVNFKDISGKREVYSFCVKENPFEEYKNIKAAVVIAGSDKRGTIYGLFHLSELLGVSPLVDWCKVLPVKKECVELSEKNNFVSKEPSVRFRGFFINDEWPAFGNWCTKNFGGVNAEMYEHVFELLLRLKGNYLWPAMWASRFSDDGPGLLNAELADELGVVMGASHHEPCCRAGEEYKYLRGKDSVYGDAWNFRSNREGITKFWEDGLKRNGKFENVITVGMRGEADTAILGKNATLKDNIDLLRDVLKTQNELIRKYVNEDEQKVPRMLALYKEVEPYFYGDKKTKGLMGDRELEGVTLMLCDDNHGNLRTVPTEKMRSHKGGYGMYYHFDYHGSPYSYEWFNTNYLPKVKEQMCAAYDFGIKDLWIVNMGDIATNEFPLSYFLDLAYDYEKFSAAEYSTQKYTSEWIEKNLPLLTDEQKKLAEKIVNSYTKISNMRRTECIQTGTYHPEVFCEADRMLCEAQKIIDDCNALKETVAKEMEEVFFQQIYLPAVGNMNVLKMQILQGKNQWYAAKGIYAANKYPALIKECLETDKALVEAEDKIADGRWHAMGWSEHFGFTHWNEEENMYPVYVTIEGTRKPRLFVWVEGTDYVTCGLDWTRKKLFINSFRNPLTEKAVVKIAAGCKQSVPYKVECNKEWLSFSSKEGTVTGEEIYSLEIKVNRELLAKDSEPCANIRIYNDDRSAGGVFTDIFVNAAVPKTDYSPNTFVQTDYYVSIEAPHFVKCEKGSDGSSFEVLSGYGKTLGAVKAFPVTVSYKNGKGAPYVEYDFVLDEGGVMAFDLFTNPSNPAYKDMKLEFIAEVNGTKLLKDAVDSKKFAVGDNQEPWGTDVTNNIRICTVYADCCAGLNKLKLYPVTPNFVLEKIVIHSAQFNMPQSYLGAPESFHC